MRLTCKRYSSKEVLSAMHEYIDDDLLIHPGETIGDVLEERDITQGELAARTGTSPAYVSEIVSGEKDISDDFALALEHALGVPASFWMNLQANYDKEKERTAKGR